jgi:hypothetical protein
VKTSISLLVFLLSLNGVSTRAGDAVVVGYNAEGAWTTITYYSSSTPKGGKDYKTSAQAREAASRDLRRRGIDQLAKESVLSDSDSTGYVAVARAKTKPGKDVIVVGRGQSQAEADKDALAKLKQAEATAGQKIAYRYHTYGADSTDKP